jgi:hypothetical protein
MISDSKVTVTLRTVLSRETPAITITKAELSPMCALPPLFSLCLDSFYNQTDRQILTHLLEPETYDRHIRPHGEKSTCFLLLVFLLLL